MYDGDGKNVAVPRRPLSVILIAIFVCGIIVCADSIVVAFHDMYAFPVSDMVGQQFQYFHQPLTNFLLHHDNEHVLVAVMPLYLVDNLLFSARGIFLVALILAFNGLIAWLLIAELRCCWEQIDEAFVAASGLTIALLFWLIHWENLIFPEQIHMYVSAVFVLLAGRYATRLDLQLRHQEASGPSAARAATIGLLLVVATFSFGYGAVGWVAVLIIALTGRWPWRSIAIVSAIFAVALVIYAGYYYYAALNYHSNPIRSLGKPIHIAIYVGYFLAAPIISPLRLFQSLGSIHAVAVGLVLGIAGFVFAIVILFNVLIRKRRRATRTDLFTAYLLIFSLGTALMAGLTRSRFGAEQALSSRYAIAQVLFWIGLGLATINGMRNRTGLRIFSIAYVGTLLIVGIGFSQFGFRAIVERQLQAHWQAVLALVDGVDDTLQISYLSWRTNLVIDLVHDFSVRHWSVYADPQPYWLNRPAAEIFRRVSPERCLGFLDEVSDLGRLKAQSFVRGWAWDAEQGRPPQWVVLIDAEGIIRGLARTGWERPDVGAAFPAIPKMARSSPGWLGYVAAPPPLAGIEGYAVLNDNTAICPLHRDTAR
jgi:hypothetical protein